jgi:hypothetical protein
MKLAHKIGSAVTSYRSRIEQRRLADHWLESATGTFVAPQHAWRAAELMAPCNRQVLARTLRNLVRAASDITWRARPVPLVAVRAHRADLGRLILRLESMDEPVTPAGILRVERLITDGAGPLYGPRGGGDDTLGSYIASTIDLLEPQAARHAA